MFTALKAHMQCKFTYPMFSNSNECPEPVTEMKKDY